MLNRENIKEIVKKEYEVSLAASLISRAHQLSDEGNLKYAFVEAVAALDIAIGEFLRNKISNDPALLKSCSSFLSLSLPAQMVVLISTMGSISSRELNSAIEAIDIRNNIAHDGYDPPDNLKDELLILLRIITILLNGSEFRFPENTNSNAVMPLEAWEKRNSKLRKK